MRFTTSCGSCTLFFWDRSNSTNTLNIYILREHLLGDFWEGQLMHVPTESIYLFKSERCRLCVKLVSKIIKKIFK